MGPWVDLRRRSELPSEHTSEWPLDGKQDGAWVSDGERSSTWVGILSAVGSVPTETATIPTASSSNGTRISQDRMSSPHGSSLGTNDKEPKASRPETLGSNYGVANRVPKPGFWELTLAGMSFCFSA